MEMGGEGKGDFWADEGAAPAGFAFRPPVSDFLGDRRSGFPLFWRLGLLGSINGDVSTSWGLKPI